MLNKLTSATLVLLVPGLFGTGTGLLKEKKEQGPSVRGAVKAVDASKKTITVAVLVDRTGKKTEEKTYPIVSGAKVTLEETFTKAEKPPVGRLEDLSAGTWVALQLDAAGKTVEHISARGVALHGSVKAADPAKHTITITAKYEDKVGEYTLEIVKGAKIIKDDGLGKKGDAPKEGTVADLTEGTPVVVQLSVDRKRVLGAHVQGESLNGTLKAYDAGNKALTVTVKEEAQIVDKELKLAENARIEGNPMQGDRVAVTISVHDKAVATAVRVIKE
jgi:hypothetical protein